MFPLRGLIFLRVFLALAEVGDWGEARIHRIRLKAGRKKALIGKTN